MIFILALLGNDVDTAGDWSFQNARSRKWISLFLLFSKCIFTDDYRRDFNKYSKRSSSHHKSKVIEISVAILCCTYFHLDRSLETLFHILLLFGSSNRVIRFSIHVCLDGDDLIVWRNSPKLYITAICTYKSICTCVIRHYASEKEVLDRE